MGPASRAERSVLGAVYSHRGRPLVLPRHEPIPIPSVSLAEHTRRKQAANSRQMASHSPSPETPERSQTPASVSSAAPVQRSCATCRRRKVRCDKKCPCTPCSRGGHACSYPPKEPRAPRVRKATINDVATRISRLEETLTSIPTREASHPHARFPASPKTVIAGPHASPFSAGGVGHETSPAAVGSPHPGGEILLEKGSSTQYFNEVLVSRVVGQVCGVSARFSGSLWRAI